MLPRGASWRASTLICSIFVSLRTKAHKNMSAVKWVVCARAQRPSGISHPSGISSSPPPLPGGAAGFGGVGGAAGFGGAAFGPCSLFHWKRQNRLVVSSNQQTSVATNGQGRTFICSIFDSLSAKRVSADKKVRLAWRRLTLPALSVRPQLARLALQEVRQALVAPAWWLFPCLSSI